MKTLVSMLILAVVGLGSLPSRAEAQQWTRFRGPNGSGISRATTIPVKWSDEDINWTVDLPGWGHGSPVVWGNRLFLNAEKDEGSRRLVLAIDPQTGQEIWRRSFSSQTHKKHRKNSYASSTPAVDADFVYTTWATPEEITLMALDHQGQVVWRKALGSFQGGHGFANSPIVYKDLVILGNDQDGDSSLMALDRHTGAIRWTTPRQSRRATYSTPCLYNPDGRPGELIFTNWQHGITGLDPQTGQVNWELSVFDTSRTERAIGSPIVYDDLVIGTCGFVTADKHAVAVRPGENGEVQEVYRLERAIPHVPTVLAYQDRLYLWNEKGIATCADVRTGEVIWRERVGTEGNFYGSPVCVNGRLYAVDDRGTVVVLAASDEFQVLARNRLEEGSRSTPAIAKGTMVLRTFSRLYSIGGPE